ncbi:hypothetical protein ACNVED_11525 [Legionella sp. D16C41]|uniref:hypothetical protein n=1 Tax=Legionella sp. D16C41 TaxID=3402688 RepID=UPI003AF82276
MLAIVGIIVLAAIFVFFSAEFGRMIKKIMAIRGVALFLPLTLVSWIVASYEPWILWTLLYVKIGFHMAVFGIVSIIPFPIGRESLATFILIYSLTLIPLAIIYWRKKKYPVYYKSNQWIITAAIWLFLLITLTVGFY